MEIINRVKNMLVAPKNEWVTVLAEQSGWNKLFLHYLLPMALIPAIGNFIGYGLMSRSVLGIRIGGNLEWGMRQAAVSLISMLGGVFLTALVINLLAEKFGAKKSFDNAFALVAYAYTPMCVAGVLLTMPSLYPLAMLAGLYGLYILYVGLQPMMQTPSEKVTPYFIVGLVCVIVVSMVLTSVLGACLAINTIGYF